jgi:nickel/cobalt transporter (NicO) family protein
VNEGILTTIAITGFGVAFFHAALPTHWLPFVLTSRVQQWNRARTIAITALAGTGHVIMTALLGLVITWLGLTVNESVGSWFPRLAGGALLLLGMYYIVRQLAGKGHIHFHYPHEHLYEGPDSKREHASYRMSDRGAIVSLLAFLTLSPCEAFLPIYVSGIRYGWAGFVLLTTILSVGTVTGMIVFTSLSLAGLSRMKLGALEKYESITIGLLLCAVGALILIFER